MFYGFSVQPYCIRIEIDYSQFFPLFEAVNHSVSVAFNGVNQIKSECTDAEFFFREFAEVRLFNSRAVSLLSIGHIIMF